MLPARIVAMGGGGFSMEPRNPRLDNWLVSLAPRKRPKVLFVPTASGDSKTYIAKFYRAFSRHACTATHLELFNRSKAKIRDEILSSDVVYVGGGNTANLLAIWRLHGVDRVMREAWQSGIVLAGVSAGALCWFQAGVTDSYGPKLEPLLNGLAFLQGSFCPHYDGEGQRRPAFRRFVRSAQLPAGLAADDGAAILFEEQSLGDVVRSRKAAAAYRVTKTGDAVREDVLEARLLRW